MKLSIKKVTLLLLLIVCSICNIFSLNSYAWQCLKEEPSIDDFPETPYLVDRPSTAIGFSGGG